MSGALHCRLARALKSAGAVCLSSASCCPTWPARRAPASPSSSSTVRRPLDTTERVIARRDADVPSKVLYRWALALFREHAPPGAARFRVRTWTQEGRPIRGVVCGRGYDAPAPAATVVPPAPVPAPDAKRRRALARAEAAEARIAALEAQLTARRVAPAPAPDPGLAAQQHRLAEQETRIKALERERAKFKDLADREKARADDWKDRALGLAVRVGHVVQNFELTDEE